MNKREFLKAGFLGLVGLSVLKAKGNSSSKLNSVNAFKTPSLPYHLGIHKVFSENSYLTLFETHIVKSIKVLNKEVQSLALAPRSVRSIIVRNNNSNSAITQYACDYYNHKLFFKLMSGESSNRKHVRRFIKEIEKKYGSVASFKDSLEKSALDLKKDAWLWVINTPKGLKITHTRDMQSPLRKSEKEFPVLGFDLCSQTYKNDYTNDKKRYVLNVLGNINWEYANKRYESSLIYLQG